MMRSETADLENSQMKTHISYQGVSERSPIQREVRRQATRLDRHLKKFDPDLVDLRLGLLRRVRPRPFFSASVTLYLPSTQLHAAEDASQPVVAVKHAFSELLRELKKFKAKLRGEDKVRRASRRHRSASI
jgi:ribosome-associated translation inhibitor RaiA